MKVSGLKINDLVDAVSSQTGGPKAETKETIEKTFQVMLNSLKDGIEVNLPAFGKFKLKESPARTGRNPSTGAMMEIAASKRIVFTPSKAVKDAVNP